MARRSKYDLERIRAAMDTECTNCRYPIPPSEYERTDGEHLRCPNRRRQPFQNAPFEYLQCFTSRRGLP